MKDICQVGKPCVQLPETKRFVLVLVLVQVLVQVIVCKYLRRDSLTKSGEDPLNLGLPRSQLPQLLPDQTTIDVNKLKTIEVITCVRGS